MLDNPPSGGASAPQLAATYLRKEILAGRFPAGMRLKTEEVAETLGISRMPVRDALRQLHAEGLVVIRPNRGALVTRLTAKEVLEAFEIRAVLEGLAARCACESLTPHVLRQIEAVLHQMDQSKEDLEHWIELHERFHEVLLAPAERPRLQLQIQNARYAVLPYVRMYISVYHQVEMPSAEHEILLTIARRRNPDLLEAAMRDHILSAGHGVADFLQRPERMPAPRDRSTPQPRSPIEKPGS
jgi:DNA-binding GntR family transcriptional regulator